MVYSKVKNHWCSIFDACLMIITPVYLFAFVTFEDGFSQLCVSELCKLDTDIIQPYC